MKGRQQYKTYLLDVGQFESLGLVGDVPEKRVADSISDIEEHLEARVWNETKSPIEALREIVRALPTAHASVDGHNELQGVLTTLNSIINLDDLPEEAKVLLKTAAAKDGTIAHPVGMGWRDIRAGAG